MYIKAKTGRFSIWLGHNVSSSLSVPSTPEQVIREIINRPFNDAQADAGKHPFWPEGPTGFRGASALHMAMLKPDNMPVIRFLIENGADPNFETRTSGRLST